MSIREIFRSMRDFKAKFELHNKNSDEYPRHGMSGEVFWTLRDSITGTETKGHHKNVVTLDAGILLATFMKGTGTPIINQCIPNFGVYALAVGTGDTSWNPLSPPPANVLQRSLYNELARKAISVTSFIKEDGTISGVRTHIVDFTTTFTEGEAVGSITEMGLIGGDVNINMSLRNPILPPNGPYDPNVDTTGKDILVNYVTFPSIGKPANSTLSWTWRLIF